MTKNVHYDELILGLIKVKEHLYVVRLLCNGTVYAPKRAVSMLLSARYFSNPEKGRGGSECYFRISWYFVQGLYTVLMAMKFNNSRISGLIKVHEILKIKLS